MMTRALPAALLAITAIAFAACNADRTLQYSDNADCADVTRGRFEHTASVEITGPLGTRTVTAEVAASQEELRMGFMCRVEIPDTEAMLFAYPDTRELSFWTFNTYVMLDMLTINADGSGNNFVTMRTCPREADENMSNWTGRCLAIARFFEYGSQGAAMSALHLPGGWLQRSGIVESTEDFAQITATWTLPPDVELIPKLPEPQAFTAVQYADHPDCQENINRGRLEGEVIHIKGPLETRSILGELAATGEEKSQGLMCRINMPDSEGMLFPYDTPTPLGFWMFNTHIPLDILFISPDGSVNNFTTMQPCTRDGQDDTEWRQRCASVASANNYSSREDSIAALELPGGWLQRSGIVASTDDFAQIRVEWEREPEQDPQDSIRSPANAPATAALLK